MHKNLFAPYTSDFLEKSIGANFPVQLSLQSQFAKIENKKGITENQCEKHKKLEFSSIKLKGFNIFFFLIIT